MSLFVASRQSLRILSSFLKHRPLYHVSRCTPNVHFINRDPVHTRGYAIGPEAYWRPELRAGKQSDPLRILFCGSDEFSCASLKAVYEEHVVNNNSIERIDVVVRPGKRTGRGRKEIQEPLLKELATALGLNVYERDTFTGWHMPDDINLIIAVSFGLFVPPRLLQAAKYGGLNLHPSLLPDLRGPAPLHHTLMQGRDVTGITLQTLDDRAYDHGVILDQTHPDPRHATEALRIPADCTTVSKLHDLVTPVAASMLVRGLRQGLHVPPHEDRRWQELNHTPEDDKPLIHAPKIQKEDSQLTKALLQSLEEENTALRDYAKKDTSEYTTDPNKGLLSRYQNAIGPLWFYARTNETGRKKQKRILITSLTEIPFKPEYPRPTTWDKPKDVRCETPFGVKDADLNKTLSNTTGLRGYAVEIQEQHLADEMKAKQGAIRRVKTKKLGADVWADAATDGSSELKTLSEGRVPISKGEENNPPSSSQTSSDHPVVEPPPATSPLEASENTTPLVGQGTKPEDTNLIFWNEPRSNTLHLSNYQINSVKVEGRSEQPAWEGLREFIKEWRHIHTLPGEPPKPGREPSSKMEEQKEKSQR
ncbi:formyl transferase [Xylariaceae sp. FL1019]|nr:formyl transferase [Xylariaceae sp. FL1019]